MLLAFVVYLLLYVLFSFNLLKLTKWGSYVGLMRDMKMNSKFSPGRTVNDLFLSKLTAGGANGASIIRKRCLFIIRQSSSKVI